MPSGGTEGEKGKRYDLVFQCCPPPPRPALLCLFPLRVCLHRYRQALCLPNTAGARDIFVPLIYPPSLLSPCSLLALTTMCYFIRNVISPLCQSSSCFSSAIKTQMVSWYSSTDFVNQCVRTVVQMLHNVTTWLDVKVQVFTSDCCHIRFLKKSEEESFAVVFFFTVVSLTCAHVLVSVSHSIWFSS